MSIIVVDDLHVAHARQSARCQRSIFQILASTLLVTALASCSSNPSEAPILPQNGESPQSVQAPQASGANGSNGLTAEQLHSDPEEIERTWASALVRIPDGAGGIIETDTTSLESAAVVPAVTLPVVIWMHGCAGFWSGTNSRIDWLAENGFAVIAPSSFARQFYPQSCNLSTQESGLYRPTLIMRQYDAGYAIERARGFSWADKSNIFLMGLSEGAAVATTYANPSFPDGYLKARVAEAWGCHAGWSEFHGIHAPESEAVLSLVADRDPWYTRDFHQGDCGEFMSESNGSFSFVVDYEPLRNRHELLDAPEIREIVLDFLLRQMLRSVD